MIKNIPYICLLLLFACGCEQKESFEYTDRDALYFMLPKEAGEPWTEGKPKALETTRSFVRFKETGMNQTYWFPEYVADTISTDTMTRVRVAVAGTLSASARDYRLKTVSTDSTLALAEISYDEKYSISANEMKDTIQFVIMRPKDGEESTAGYVTFDTENSPAFPTSITGWDRLKVNCVYYAKPEKWSNDIFGVFSQAKYAFMVETLKTTYDYYDWITDDNWQATYGLPELRKALKKYNEEHPESPKDFTFPGME